MTRLPLRPTSPLLVLLTPALALAAALPAQTRYSTESFEAPAFTVGQLAGTNLWNGQDGWLVTGGGGLFNPTNVTVQTRIVRSGTQAACWDASLDLNPYAHLRTNQLFTAAGWIEIEFDFYLESSSQPSGAWGLASQPYPHPLSEQVRWVIVATGEVWFLDGVHTQSNTTWNRTGSFIARDRWHHARTVIDMVGNRTELHIDGILVASGAPNSAIGAADHGFSSIYLDQPGNDRFYFDNFTVRDRPATPQLSVDLERVAARNRHTIEYRLAGGSSLANRSYALLGSMSGTSPGTQIGSVTVPLASDVFQNVLLANLGSPAMPGFIGAFNGDGNAYASLDTLIALPASLVGQAVSFAYVTFNPTDVASNPVSVRITP